MYSNAIRLDPKSLLGNQFGIFEILCMGDFSPITHFCKIVWPRNQTRAQWVVALQNLESTDITWKAPWMPRESMLYGYGDNLWVLLLGVWGAISYAPLLVRRQYLST